MIEPSARYNAIVDAPVSVDIGSRRARRGIVVALYGSYFLICGATAARTLLDPPAGRVVAAILLIAGTGAAAYGFFALMGRTFINAPNIRASALDERQRERRNDAIQRAFPVIGMVSALCLLYAIVTGSLVPAWRNDSVVDALFWGVFLLCISLPSAIIAWTEPDQHMLDER
jgi:hypothetical protein